MWVHRDRHNEYWARRLVFEKAGWPGEIDKVVLRKGVQSWEIGHQRARWKDDLSLTGDLQGRLDSLEKLFDHVSGEEQEGKRIGESEGEKLERFLDRMVGKEKLYGEDEKDGVEERDPYWSAHWDARVAEKSAESEFWRRAAGRHGL